MQRIVEEIQNILQSDYVVLFRSYVTPDGNQHNFKLGLEYPSGSGKYVFDDGTFEAIEPPPVPEIKKRVDAFAQKIPLRSDGPSFDTKAASDASGAAAPVPAGTDHK
jgi:hypothetical protein